MPVGEFIAEMGLRLVVEIVFYGLFYWVGFCVLKVFTFGGVTLAPLSTVGERHKGRKIDWSIYLYRSGKRMLKAEFTALAGMIFSIGVTWAYFHFFPKWKMSRTDAAYHDSGEGETPPHVGAYNRGRNFLTASGVDGKCDFAGWMGLV